MNFRTVAHDPSGPAGHLPSFAGEEGMSATGENGNLFAPAMPTTE